MKRILAMLLLGFCALAHAHKPSDSYLILKVAEGGVAGQWDIALRDLEYAIGLDADGDGEITWGELSARRSALAVAKVLPSAAIATAATQPVCPFSVATIFPAAKSQTQI